MFEQGGFGGAGALLNIDEIHHDTDSNACIAGLLGVLRRDKITENVRRARIIETISEILDIRYTDADCAGGDPSEAHREALCEVSAALGTSLAVAAAMLAVAERLGRLPLTAIRFVSGSLDWAHLTVLTDMLGTASASTIDAIEHHAVAAAERYNPRSLRKKIWYHWTLHNPDEAAAAQAVANKRDARVTIDPADHGMALLTAHLTDLQGAEAEALITDIAATVCPKDPRTLRQLRVDGLIALLHGEHALECTCQRAENCPVAGVADTNPPRRGHLLQILITVEALLGLTSTPATLADGTALDPVLVRQLAGDTRWQAILAELVAVLDTAEGEVTTTEKSAEPEGAAKAQPAESMSSVEPGDAAEPGGTTTLQPTKPMPPTEPAPPIALTRMLGRGRVRPAACFATAPICKPILTTSVQTSGDDSARNRYIAALRTRHHADPTHGVLDLTGHGALSTPPPGALTYRPAAATAALVRTAYRTCTFANCEVPSARCQLDHIVPFGHAHPEAGGWSIASNLHPVCTCHHQAKTANMWDAVMHTNGVVVWTSRTGDVHITVPDFALPTALPSRRRKNSPPHFDPNKKTWWEIQMADAQTPPTATDQRTADTSTAKNRIRTIRRKFREHKATQRLRQRHAEERELPPF